MARAAATKDAAEARRLEATRTRRATSKWAIDSAIWAARRGLPILRRCCTHVARASVAWSSGRHVRDNMAASSQRPSACSHRTASAPSPTRQSNCTPCLPWPAARAFAARTCAVLWKEVGERVPERERANNASRDNDASEVVRCPAVSASSRSVRTLSRQPRRSKASTASAVTSALRGCLDIHISARLSCSCRTASEHRAAWNRGGNEPCPVQACLPAVSLGRLPPGCQRLTHIDTESSPPTPGDTPPGEEVESVLDVSPRGVGDMRAGARRDDI
mmetsp:Transcript_62512/g.148169  ORF Transcript_62512/g.148169 Transcript_62512/m.148169 type:complete len:275 (-) Transcript_62512:76-900(-)